MEYQCVNISALTYGVMSDGCCDITKYTREEPCIHNLQ